MILPIPSIIRAVVAAQPSTFHELRGFARWIAVRRAAEYKTYDFFLSTLTRMVRTVYDGYLAGEFIDIMASLINGQINQAYRQAWDDEGIPGEPMPDYLTNAAEEMVLNQYDFVDQYFKDIVAARLDKTPIDPLLARAEYWANQWNVAYKDGVQRIRLENGGNLVWRKGQTEHGCQTCADLDGICMSAREWEELDVHPRGFPNPKLGCNGGGPAGYCDCELEPTTQRRSPKAFETVLNIVTRV